MHAIAYAPVIRVYPVQTAEEREAFLDFADQCYAEDPARVAPLRARDRRRLDPDSAFLRHNELVLLVAYRDGEIAGTISVLRDRKHNELKDEQVAFFGFFECDGTQVVADALFDAAEAQARTWGCTVLRGPRNLSRIEETGLLIEGFDTPSPMLAGHHPRWYRPLFERAGFTKHHDVLAYETSLYDERGHARPLPDKLAAQAAEVDIEGLEVRSVRWRRVLGDLRLAHRVFVDAFRDVPENTPMPLAQFVSVGLVFLLFTSRHMLQVATVNGKPAGFALCFPELHEAIAEANGRLDFVGILGLLRGVRTMRTASFKLLGLLPEHRGSGLHALLIERALEGVRDAGYRRLEASLVDARNAPMRKIVEGAGMAIYKRYRVYERALA